ncbi:ras-related protein Rab-34-like [Uloborus diversus]|uniref:ras-related protein Rab-34-like n=1 Tax=Uloborus diversus TaxID=327109 RepID=UPI00240A9428|nr:ras-related protein Rab-34-like [Uloborus diversus]
MAPEVEKVSNNFHYTSLFKHSHYTMENAAEERTITKFPMPFDVLCSPYKEREFSAEVYNVCYKINSKNIDMLRISKVIVVGDVAVGKTCLVRRFCLQPFDTNYKATIGVDFEAKKFYILDVPYILQMWDTAGQEKFKCIASSYYRGAKVVILVFDFSLISSLYNIPTWLERTMKCTESPLLFLVGTKKDVVANSAYKLTEIEAVKIAKAIGAEYWPVSSKTGENVEALISRIAVLTFSQEITKETENKIEKVSNSFVKISRPSVSGKKNRKCSACA